MSEFDQLVELFRTRRVVVLTGAGCSTDSGIPDYRGPDGTQRKRPPIQYQEFVRDPFRRARYWARSVVGHARFASSRPNAAHHALAALEARRAIKGVITQNVDRLHHAAGSRRVVELHGALARVRCLDCGVTEARETVQDRLLALNPWLGEAVATQAPDGDAELDGALVEGFRMAPCLACGGAMLKPDVVFFGDSVPRERVRAVTEAIDAASGMLVVGSSLMVYSGFRFAEHAQRAGKPVIAVNLGRTRADHLLAAKVEQDCDAFLAGLCSVAMPPAGTVPEVLG